MDHPRGCPFPTRPRDNVAGRRCGADRMAAQVIAWGSEASAASVCGASPAGSRGISPKFTGIVITYRRRLFTWTREMHRKKAVPSLGVGACTPASPSPPRSPSHYSICCHCWRPAAVGSGGSDGGADPDSRPCCKEIVRLPAHRACRGGGISVAAPRSIHGYRPVIGAR